MQSRGRRSLTAIFFAISVVATLLVPTAPATAHHGTSEDCERQSGYVDGGTELHYCVPDGNWGVTLYQPYKRYCRYDGTINWGDGATETVTDWMDLSTAYHQYTSHGVFTLVLDLAGRGGPGEGGECTDVYSTATVEVPVPKGEPTPVPTPTNLPEEDARVASSIFPLTNRIDEAKKEFQPRIDALVATHERLDEELGLHERALQDRIETHTERLTDLEAIQWQFVQLSEQVADGIGDADSAEMDRLRGLFREARVDELAARQLVQNMDRDVQNLLVERDGVRRRLLQLVEPLEALDFELRGLVVQADSVPVYAVDLTSPYVRLAQLDREIQELREILAEIAIEKKDAIDSFSGVHEAGSRQLAAIADLIWRNALIKASADLATNTADVLIAGAKGGLAGAAAEAASKLYVGFLEYQTAGPIGDPNPGKDAVDAWFKESVAETVGQSATTLGLSRGFKETAGKLAKDYLTEEIGQLFPRLQGGTPSDEAAPGVTSHQERRSRGFLKRLKGLAPKLKNENVFKTGFREWAKGSLGRKLITDVSKAALSHTLQRQEMEAWREYIRLDTQAQGLFSLWQAAANAFWETSDQIEARELEKSQLLLGFDPATGQSVRVQESFRPPLTLEVRLVVPRSAKPFKDVPVQVFVSGTQMSRIGSHRFHVAFDKLPASERDALVVEVR